MADALDRIAEPPPIGLQRVLVLDREGTDVDYRVVGGTECVDCAHPVFLSPRALPMVLSGAALPLCQPCAAVLADTGLLSEADYIGRLP
jgi:hypothetical protein